MNISFTQEYILLLIFILGIVIVKFNLPFHSGILKVKDNKINKAIHKKRKIRTMSMNLKPVKLPKNYKGTVIVAFTDINYWPVAKLWFKQISSLNYTDIRLYALDKLVHKEMMIEIKNKNSNLRLENIFLPATGRTKTSET